MRILVTGGTGVIGAGLIPELLERGHQVRLMSRRAEEEAAAYPDEVEEFSADVTSPESLESAVAGCDAIVHIAGIVDESPPEVTFDRVNVEGTANLLAEAGRAGSPRFVYISSLGAERGSSPYHHSKRAAEQLVREYQGEWIIVRPGNVFGPGDEVLSKIVRMARSLPVVPLVGDGSQPFQPLWYEDAGKGIAAVLERTDLAGEALDMAGGEVTTMREVVEKIASITKREVVAVPIPAAAAFLAAGIAKVAGIEAPASESKLTMLLEENRIEEGGTNALTLLEIEPTSLDEGLRRLVHLLPARGPEDGVGALEEKRFWADIEGAEGSAETVIADLRVNFLEILPITFGVEGEDGSLREGETLTADLPLRGHIQVRVEELAPRRITLMAIEGHPMAGWVRFCAEPQKERIRFMIEIDARAASWWDFMMLKGGGDVVQRWNWEEVVRRVVERSAGQAPDGIQTSRERLEGPEADRAEQAARGLIDERLRTDRDPRGDREQRDR